MSSRPAGTWLIPTRKWSHDREYRNRRRGHRPRELRRGGARRPRRCRGRPFRRVTGRDRQEPCPHRGTRAQPQARLRGIHRVRRTGHPPYPPRAANPVTAQPDSLTRRRIGSRGRTRGRQGHDAAAVVDAGHRAHGCAARGRSDVSGDLAPLAHVALTAIGEGSVRTDAGELLPSADALARHGIEPVVLAEKEGLALINGTDGMLGMLVLALRDLDRLLKLADVAASMSVEGQLGSDRVFAEDLHAMRPHPGQAAAAANMRRLLAASPIVASHSGPDCSLVQDAYSLRCAPQVAGAARDTVEHARTVAGRELASAVDNPVVTLDGRVESNGNFHGAPVGYVLDFLAIAVADLASISERRTDRFLDRTRSHGLNPFLADDPGVDSGHMIAQYTQAAIVSELKRLANPASVDSIPSSAMQEDHVSMGWSAARKLRRAIDGLTRVLAIEVYTAARGIDMRTPLAASPATAAVIAAVRESVPGPDTDRYLSPEIDAVVALAASGTLVTAAESVTGPLA